MALQPSLRPLIVIGSSEAPHTLDVFCEEPLSLTDCTLHFKLLNHALLTSIVDYVCPYRCGLLQVHSFKSIEGPSKVRR